MPANGNGEAFVKFRGEAPALSFRKQTPAACAVTSFSTYKRSSRTRNDAFATLMGKRGHTVNDIVQGLLADGDDAVGWPIKVEDHVYEPTYQQAG